MFKKMIVMISFFCVFTGNCMFGDKETNSLKAKVLLCKTQNVNKIFSSYKDKNQRVYMIWKISNVINSVPLKITLLELLTKEVTDGKKENTDILMETLYHILFLC